MMICCNETWKGRTQDIRPEKRVNTRRLVHNNHVTVVALLIGIMKRERKGHFDSVRITVTELEITACILTRMSEG